MPEGDTIHQAATRLREVLDGQVLESVEGSHHEVRREGRRLVGRRVTGVESLGKHLLVHVDRGWSLRTHLGMPGSWHVYREGDRWRRSPGAARVVLRSNGWVAVCFAAPSVQIAPTDMVLERVGHLGPDAITDDFDGAEAVRRAGDLPDDTAALDVVLDQRVMAGVGNVFANEILFLEGVHPLRRLGTLDDATLSALIARAHRLLVANRSPGARATTGSTRRGEELWVYGRSGRPCRRCGTRLTHGHGGIHRRVITWCPSCQGAAA